MARPRARAHQPIPSSRATVLRATEPHVPDAVLRVHGFVPKEGGNLLADAELFVGVTALEAVEALHQRGRRLPLAIWLRVADELLAGLAPVCPDDRLPWLDWSGPRAFGVELDGRVALFLAPDGAPGVVGDLSMESGVRRWRDVRPGGPHLRPVSAGATAALALVYLLEAWPVREDRERPTGWNRAFTHPELTPALKDALSDALYSGGGPEELRDALKACAPVAAAPPTQVAATFVAACPETLVRRGRFAQSRAHELPVEWQDQGLLVAIDHALETCALIEDCPADPLATPSTEAVLAAESMPVLPTPSLRLEVEAPTANGRRFLNNVAISGLSGVPPRIWLTAHGRPPPGSPLVLTLVHPVQQDVRVELAGVVTPEGTAKVGAPVNAALYRRLLAALSAVEAGGAVPASQLPRGAVDTRVGPLAVSAGVALGFLGASAGLAHLARGSWCAGAMALVAVAASVLAVRLLVEHWPLGNAASTVALAVAGLGAAQGGRAAPGLFAPAVALGVAMVLCALGLDRSRVGAWQAASRFRRAAVRRGAQACSLCGRRHGAVRFEVCQYGNCQRPLEARQTCTCDPCLALGNQAARERTRQREEAIERANRRAGF